MTRAPIPAAEYGARRARVAETLADTELAAVLVSDPADVRYLSGFRGDDTMLVIGRDIALICTDSRYWEQVRAEVAGFELVEVRTADLISTAVAALADRSGHVALGYQGAHLTHADYMRLRRRHRGRLRDLRRRLSRLRVVKDAHEIALIHDAAAITDEALRNVVAQGFGGRSEADVAWSLLTEFHRLGAEGEAFATIVAAGDHAAHAHAIPGRRVIAAGELVLIDTGARLEGYCSDITRTFAVGQPAEPLRTLYATVLAAQQAGIAAVRDGAHGRDDVDSACRAVIAAAGHGDHFGHGTGHGVGLEIHEAPALGMSRGDTLRAGMVCTVEPGIYVDGWAGVRIEDTVLVTPNGCERLTLFPKELQVVA